MAVPAVGVWMEVMLALGVLRDAVWLEVIGRAADRVMDDIMSGLRVPAH